MESSIEWRVEPNPLTNPPSYRVRIIPKDTIGYKQLSERIALKNPVCSVEQVEAVLRTRDQEILEILLEGCNVALEESFDYSLSATGRMAEEDDQLPPNSVVNVNINASRAYAEAVRKRAKLVRKPPEHKVPVIASAKDTVLELSDVLNPDGLLRLTGTQLLFDKDKGTGECVLEGTREGRTVQRRFGTIKKGQIIVIPEIPSQTLPWNNEYRVSVSTRYTAHGSLRTGTYQRLLRTPLAVQLGANSGILSGGTEISVPLVRVTGGHLNEEGARVRIQAAIDALSGELRFRLLDMKENGAAGEAVHVSGNNAYTLPGYAGSGLDNLEVTVLDYAALLTKIREEYQGRMVDILDVGAGS